MEKNEINRTNTNKIRIVERDLSGVGQRLGRGEQREEKGDTCNTVNNK